MRRQWFIGILAVLLLAVSSCGREAETSEEIPKGDGRGDLIPSETVKQSIPVLMGGALPFTGMENLRTENDEDGTYLYEDMTEDGQTVIVNGSYRSSWLGECPVEEYLQDAALAVAESDTCELLSFEQDENLTASLSYPAYMAVYRAGENEDLRQWDVLVMETDGYTYFYGISATMDAAEENKEWYQDLFSQLYLSDPE